MIKQHLKTAWRTTVKDKTYATINILGLTIGLCACMLVATVVIDHLSYDRFWSRADDLYKINMYYKIADGAYDKQPSSPAGLRTPLIDQFPEIENFASIQGSDLQIRINKDDSRGISISAINADSSIWNMLDLKAVSGQHVEFIAGQPNLLITESFRDKYFSGKDPIGKTVYGIQSEDPSYVITAVIKNIPQNTHLRAEAILLHAPHREELSKMGYGSYTTNYVLLKPGTDVKVLADKINKWYAEYREYDDKQTISFEFQSIKDVYLHSDFDGRLAVKSSLQQVYIFGGVGILLLLIACINFVNLSTAKVVKRLQETGVRKVLGATRSHLIMQFVTESLLFFTISTVLACMLYALAIPPLQNFLGYGLTHTLISGWPIFFITVVCVFSISLVTGIYPAWLMSDFRPATTLRGKLTDTAAFAPNWIRQTLVILQFAIAIVVLVALLVVNDQLSYLNQKDLGYNKDHLLYISRQSWEGKGDAFKMELLKIRGVDAVSIAGWEPQRGTSSMQNTFDHPLNEGEKLTANFIVADFDFPQTIGVKLHQGRFLDPAYGNDSYSIDSTMRMDKAVYEAYRDSRSILTTVSTAKMLGIDTLGNTIRNIGYRPAGIVADLHHESLHHTLGPLFILAQKSPKVDAMFIRIAPDAGQQVLSAISRVWKQFYPHKVFEAAWVRDLLQKQYEAEQKQQTLFSFFGGLMLFVSALGVFGLIIHAAEQRTKEIGIRKVLGASVFGIVGLLSKDFVKLVVIAAIIASPIAWWAMNNWLEDFAYRIEVQWSAFALAATAALLIALLTVSWQAIRAALANPVESLRDE